MALYEERLAKDLAKIRHQLATLCGMVEQALQDSVLALLAGNHALANNTVLGDQPINRKVAEINRLSHSFLAIHLPSAGHLRMISSILRINSELERIGDYAVTISREAVQLHDRPAETLKGELEFMSGQALDMLRKSIAAFNADDADLARATMGLAEQLERRRDSIFRELAENGSSDPAGTKDRFVLFVVFNMLERVSDRAQNICEETLFVVTGVSKQKKTYNILFLDDENNCQSVIAEAVARKTYGSVATFNSAGRKAAGELQPGLSTFMPAHGLEVPPTPPKAVDPDSAGLEDCDIVVSLQGPVTGYIPNQPFHTVFLEWDVGEPPIDLDKSETVDRFHSMYRETTVQVRNLMELLLGEEGV